MEEKYSKNVLIHLSTSWNYDTTMSCKSYVYMHKVVQNSYDCLVTAIPITAQ